MVFHLILISVPGTFISFTKWLWSTSLYQPPGRLGSGRGMRKGGWLRGGWRLRRVRGWGSGCGGGWRRVQRAAQGRLRGGRGWETGDREGQPLQNPPWGYATDYARGGPLLVSLLYSVFSIQCLYYNVLYEYKAVSRSMCMISSSCCFRR